MEITKETTMGELLSYDRGVAVVLMQAGMHCIGCPSSVHESLEEACLVHGIEAEELLANIKKFFEEQK
jgi:hybrid cluster-associated redox disulfide protein